VFSSGKQIDIGITRAVCSYKKIQIWCPVQWRETLETREPDSFPRFEKFKIAVDQALLTPLPSLSNIHDYTVAYKAIQIVIAPAGSNEGETQYVEREDELWLISEEITIASVVANCNSSPYFELAHVLRDALGSVRNIPAFNLEDGSWIEAIRIANAYLSTKEGNGTEYERYNNRTLSYARSINFFRKKGISFPVIGRKARINERSSEASIVELAYGPLRKLGDVNAMRLVGEQLSLRYDPLLKRVRLHPTPDTLGNKVNGSLPIGYLYRLALRLLGTKRKAASQRPNMTALHDALMSIGALHDVEPFTIYESMRPPLRTRSLEVLRDVVIYDELFTVPQCDPRLIEDMLRHLLKGLITDSKAEELNWGLEDAIRLWRLILSLLPFNGAPMFIRRADLNALLSRHVSASVAEALLSTFILKRPNSTYGLPSDAAKADTCECALVEASNGLVWIAPLPFIGPAFFSRITEVIAANFPVANRKIGKNFEQRFFERMREAGIVCLRGEVGTPSSILGEVDLVLQSSNVVALFELKKKGLSEDTNAGNDLTLAADLARGVIHAVNQLGKLEALLLRTGKLKFLDGTELHLGDRQIIKVVVSLADHGGLHDSITFQNMLESLRGAVLSPLRELTSEQERCLVDANRALSLLQQRYEEFEKHKPAETKLLFGENAIFHNIYFIEYLLQKFQDPEEIISALLLGERMSNGTRDPFITHQFFAPKSTSK
jgi:hypothetical protein